MHKPCKVFTATLVWYMFIILYNNVAIHVHACVHVYCVPLLDITASTHVREHMKYKYMHMNMCPSHQMEVKLPVSMSCNIYVYIIPPYILPSSMVALHLKHSRVRLWLSVPHSGHVRPTMNSSQREHLFLEAGLTK